MYVCMYTYRYEHNRNIIQNISKYMKNILLFQSEYQKEYNFDKITRCEVITYIYIYNLKTCKYSKSILIEETSTPRSSPMDLHRCVAYIKIPMT